MQDRESLLQEIEQLRTTLEESLEENSRLFAAMNLQRRRIEDQTHALQSLTSRLGTDDRESADPGTTQVNDPEPSHADEELRVAFEELQVMAEELEVANGSLLQANRELDERVEARTQELGAANVALRNSEAMFRAVVDLVPDFLWRTGRSGQVLWYNRRWYEYTGAAESDSLGEGWFEAVHPADRAAARMAWANAVASARAYEGEHRIRGDDGAFRWFLIRAEPIRDAHGNVLQWFGAATDVHDYRVARESLRESEARFRTLIEGMPQLAWRSKSGGRWTWASPQWIGYTGLSEAASRGRGWLRALHPDDRESAEAAWTLADQGEAVVMEARVYCKAEGRHRHFRTRANPVRSADARILEWLGTSTDVDDLLELQQRQTVLVAELQHRTRNLIAVVRSIAIQTLRTSDSLATFEAEFEHRLAALSRVQGLLSRAEDQQVTIGALIRMELDALGSPSSDERVHVAGPDVPLRKSQVQTLALAIHELATNARKHGALASRTGRLQVGWDLDAPDGTAAPQLRVDWLEETQPRPPSDTNAVRSSFGRELIESALPYALGAKTSFHITDRELHCTISLPLSRPDT